MREQCTAETQSGALRQPANNRKVTSEYDHPTKATSHASQNPVSREFECAGHFCGFATVKVAEKQ
jgi:hypothetical protein